jgi:hypothetical protein
MSIMDFNCRACGTHNLSTAKHCVMCGEKLSHSWSTSTQILIGAAIIGVVVLGNIALALLVESTPQPKAPTAADSPSHTQGQVLTPSQRAEMQAERDKMCAIERRLIAAGAFTKVEAGYSGVTHAYAGSAFFAVPVDAKESSLKAVSMCHISLEEKNQMGIVVIHNGYSGKEIGKFSFVSGLEMY